MSTRTGILTIAFLFWTLSGIGQVSPELPKIKQYKDTTFQLVQDDPILSMIDSMIAREYFQSLGFKADNTNYKKDSVPRFTPEVYEERLNKLNSKTPFSLVYNDVVSGFINLYANRRRSLTAKELGLAKVYFPIFEEHLDKYDMPLELKYLAIVESALNPRAKSHAGATGLWQFMYRTGRMYGLEVNSYYDERMSIHQSTDAACRYLKKLYGLYHDWDLALAAYNCGPGNVNRALRRAGEGKTSYWEIYDYLPRETRGYVPAFIAVNYVMNYHKEHNIKAREAKVPLIVTDTVYVHQFVSFDQLSEALDIPVPVLEHFNPEYKLNVVPYGGDPRLLTIPAEKVGLFVKNEKQIYAHKTEKEKKDSIAAAGQMKTLTKAEYVTHVVKKGEVLGGIAERYKCRVSQIRDWNNMRGANIYIGQKLKIYTSRRYPPNSYASVKRSSSASKTSGGKVTTSGKYQYYTVRSGDNLWVIAQRFNGVTVESIQRLNPGLNPKRLQPGMKIKLKKVG